MKSLFIFSSLILSLNAFAGCEDAEAISSEAALKLAAKSISSSCKVLDVKQSMDWPAKSIEGWTVNLQCPAANRSVYVVLFEIEDAYCEVKKAEVLSMDGSQCGLTDMFGGDEEGNDWSFDDSREITLQDLNEAQIKTLPKVIQQQIAVAAGEKISIDPVTAVKTLLEGSEGEEAYVKFFTFKGVKYTTVHSYPGGNSYGPIFKEGSNKLFASNGDDSISCAE